MPRHSKTKKTKDGEEKIGQADENGSQGMEAELLTGTNVEAVERQKTFRERLSENARTRRKRSRPKRRSSNEPTAAGLQNPPQNVGTEAKQPPIVSPGTKQPPIVSPGTKQPPIVSSGTKPPIVSPVTKQPPIVSPGTKQPPIVSPGTKQPPIVSPRTKQPAIVSPGTKPPLTYRAVPVVQEKPTSFLEKNKSETDDEVLQDDPPRPVADSDGLCSREEFYERNETEVLSDDGELDWYEESVRKFKNDQTDDVEEEEIYLSHQQKEKFKKRKRRDRDFYKPLIKNEDELDRMIKKEPRKYKRCILKIESSHKSIAKVLEKGNDAICEILINGRSKCGQSYMDDEVVVEIVNPRRAGDAPSEPVFRGGVRRDADNLAYGDVVGMYPSKRKRFKDVDHPVLFCTLDEMEDHLMKPLCKTIPKVHVMHSTIKNKDRGKVKNRVEIKRIVNGYVQSERVMKIDPEKRDLYIFRVVVLTWSHQTIYPLGAVLEVGIGGTDFSGLEVLCLQQQVRKLYPRNVVQEVNNLLAETSMLGRHDITNEKVFTIDPPGSKDLDDALSIKKEGQDFVVGVHIADVASVVKKGSEVDEEAKKRAVTFYPSYRRSYSMLPEPLSHGKCSLLANQIRPTVSVFFNFDKSGILRKDKDPRIERTVIKSRRQFTYSEVQKIITNTLGTHEFAWDIHHLHMIASKLGEKRIGDRRLYVPFEDPRIGDLHDTEGDVEAHALVEELMILTNKHIAKCLKANPLYANVLILRSHKSPTQQQLAEWRHKEGNVANLVFKLQGKKTSPGHELSLEAGWDERQQGECVVVQENIWTKLARCFETGNWAEARKLACTDALHPLQCLANEHWIEMMETAEYKCAHGLNEPDVSHFDLEVTCYTHFTSPIRRYADLHVHRLLHAYLDGQPPDCTPEEVIQLCLHLTSATSRQKAFSRGCRSLRIASKLEQQPLVFRAYVNKVDSERLGLYLPSLQSISDRKQELPFSMLGVTSQPEVTTDKVRVEWNVKIYNNKDTCPVEFQRYVRQRGTTKGILTIDISSHQLSVLVLQKDWITTLRKISRHVARHDFLTLPRTGVKYITSELGKAFSDTRSETRDGDNNEIRSCLFQAQFSPGQVLQVQMSAKPSRGLLSPQLDLVQLTRNVTICTRHLKDSVTCLSRPATRVVRDKGFTNHKDYLDAWMPLLEMEAAAEAGDSGLGTMVENVRVTIKREASSSGAGPAVFRGTFRLPTTFCFNRSIEFGGAEPESLKDDEELTGTPSCPLDYLCIRYQVNCGSTIKSKAQASSFAPVIDTHFTWVGHAGVVSVKKVTAGRGGHERIKSGSKKTKAKDKKQQEEVFVEVSFSLTHNSPQPPPQLMVSEGADVFLEIMPKTEVTRRAQEMLSEIKKEGCELAQALAYGTKQVPPPLDERHLNLGRRSSCEVNVRGLGGKPLPGNNDRQAKAIQTALTNTLSTIQGPPGTGKSYTGVKLVYLFNKINQQLAREGKGKKKTILFCGPSNKSVDHVARILKERLGASCPKLVRMYGSAIETKDYPIPQTHVQTRRGTKDLKSDPSLQEISLHHIIRRNGNKHAEEINQLDNFFARCLEEPNEYKATREKLERHRELVNKASIEELGNYEVILTTCAMGGNKKLVKGAKEQIFQVIIDECAMSPEPHSLVPIVANKAKQVVLIGDHKQLRPIIRCKQAEELGLDQSLFERLYEKYPKQRVFLDKQYRMHPKICEFPSRAFYDGKLITESSLLWEGEPLPFWTSDRQTQKKIPHMLVDIKGNEEMLTVSTEEGNEKSKSNVQEVEKVAEIFVYLKKEFKLDVANIKILSQYNAQRNLIEQRLHQLCEDREVFDRYDQHKVNVSTVVSSQGGEWDYVIVSTVRSLPSYKIEPHATLGWCHQNMGFITDQNQVNVALTRARRGLIIVGDKELLECDPLWKDLIQSYEHEHCIKKAHEFPPPPSRRRRRRN